MSVGINLGNVKALGMLTVNVDAGSISANATLEVTKTVKGIQPTDFVAISNPYLSDDVAPVAARASAKDEISITYMNPTSGSVDPGAQDIKILWVRAETPNETQVRE